MPLKITIAFSTKKKKPCKIYKKNHHSELRYVKSFYVVIFSPSHWNRLLCFGMVKSHSYFSLNYFWCSFFSHSFCVQFQYDSRNNIELFWQQSNMVLIVYCSIFFVVFVDRINLWKIHLFCWFFFRFFFIKTLHSLARGQHTSNLKLIENDSFFSFTKFSKIWNGVLVAWWTKIMMNFNVQFCCNSIENPSSKQTSQLYNTKLHKWII